MELRVCSLEDCVEKTVESVKLLRSDISGLKSDVQRLSIDREEFRSVFAEFRSAMLDFIKQRDPQYFQTMVTSRSSSSSRGNNTRSGIATTEEFIHQSSLIPTQVVDIDDSSNLSYDVLDSPPTPLLYESIGSSILQSSVEIDTVADSDLIIPNTKSMVKTKQSIPEIGVNSSDSPGREWGWERSL